MTKDHAYVGARLMSHNAHAYLVSPYSEAVSVFDLPAELLFDCGRNEIRQVKDTAGDTNLAAELEY